MENWVTQFLTIKNYTVFQNGWRCRGKRLDTVALGKRMKKEKKKFKGIKVKFYFANRKK